MVVGDDLAIGRDDHPGALVLGALILHVDRHNRWKYLLDKRWDGDSVGQSGSSRSRISLQNGDTLGVRIRGDEATSDPSQEGADDGEDADSP